MTRPVVQLVAFWRTPDGQAALDKANEWLRQRAPDDILSVHVLPKLNDHWELIIITYRATLPDLPDKAAP